jgi:hypothetical protein
VLHNVSVIVPIAPGETRWMDLLRDLRSLPPGAEVFLVGTEPAADCSAEIAGLRAAVVWLESPPGRARQMNLGAARAGRPFLWFVHADSRVSPESPAALGRSLAEHPQALHYSNLAFLGDGPRLMPLNAAGVWFRSHVLGMPFGDQGLCLSGELFDALGRFDEQARYGEDHLLVWAARRAGVPLRCCGGVVHTSARKYHHHGWSRTTGRHLWLTAKQALPQYAGLWGDRIRSWMRQDRLTKRGQAPSGLP